MGRDGVFPPETRCRLLETVLGLWWMHEVIFDWRFFKGFYRLGLKIVRFIVFFKLAAGFCNTSSNF